MMLDDHQFAQFLTMNNLVTLDQLDALQLVAEEAEQPLYVTVIENQAVPEEVLVGLLAQVMNVSSVSLHDFDADPQVLRRIPSSLARQIGVLPVGVGVDENADVLYIAMANPHDEGALKKVRSVTRGRVEPLLAGPIDLLRAMERAYQQKSPTAEHDLNELSARMLLEPTAHEDVTNSVDDDDALEAARQELDDVFGSFYEQQPGEVVSALSLLDDIPRDRHEHDTSPNVLSMIDGLPEPARRAESSADNSLFPSFDDDPVRPPAASFGARPQAPSIPSNAAPKPRPAGLSGLFGVAGSHTTSDAAGSSTAPALSEPDVHSATGIGRPAPRVSGSFQRVAKRSAMTPAAMEPPTIETAGIGPLSRAAIQVLIRKGVLTAAEINEELLRNRG